jgi:hypothetical protein
MFLIQTSRAKRTRKYSFLMIAFFLLTASLGSLFTMHWDVRPKKK